MELAKPRPIDEFTEAERAYMTSETSDYWSLQPEWIRAKYPELRQVLENYPSGLVATNIHDSIVRDGPSSSLLFMGVKEKLFKDIPGFPLPKLQLPPSVELRAVPESPNRIPNQRLGVFATRALRPGEIFFTERPLVVMPCGLPVQEHLANLLEALKLSLGDQGWERLNAFPMCRPVANADAGERVREILSTNAIGATIPIPGCDLPIDHPALFETICRCHHE